MDHGNAWRLEAQLLCQAGDGARRTRRVGGAEVADDANAVLQAVGQHRPQKIQHQRLKACIGVALACQLGQGQRALGQGLENQHRRLGLANQLLYDRAGGIDAVARESGGAADQQGGGVGRG